MATPVGGAQSAHNPSDSVNGRNQTIPAIPAVNGGASSNQDHSRKPSMTVTPAGANFNPNGSAAAAPQNKPNVQFGNMSAQGGSPAQGNPALAHQSNNSLGVNQLNPNQRAASPQGSPSPIPQPREMSGGRPPSTYGSQGNGMVFGQQGDQNDPSGQPRPVSSLQFGNHDRRGSSHSMHSDIGGPPTGPGNRNFPGPTGRGRGAYPSGNYGQQMPHSPYNSYRGQPNGRGVPSGYGGRGQAVPGYVGGSPAMGTRSPAMIHAQPGTPQQMHMNMAPNGMQGPPSYPYYQGPQPVKPPSVPPLSEPTRGKKGRTRGSTRGVGGRARGGKGPQEDRPRFSRDPASENYRPDIPPGVALYSFPDLSPESGNFESLLTNQSQGIPTHSDPSIQSMYSMNMGYAPMQGGQFASYMPPQSPRPYQQGYPMQPTYSNQGQPPNMSRTSSQMSNAPDRPGSSIGQQPHTPSVSTPSVPSHANARTPSISQGQKPGANFTIPDKTKRAAIVIKNPTTGEAVSFKDKAPASPAPTPTASASAAAAAPPTPSAPTPPSRTPSAVEPSHTRTESISAKTEEEKKRSMQEAVKARIAEQAKQQGKLEDEVLEKSEIDHEASDAAKQQAAAAQATAEKLEQEAALAKEKSEAVDVPEKAAEPAKDEPTASSKPADDDEIDFDAIEAELAAQEAEEARREEEYQKKKAAEKAAQAEREKEQAEAFEANIKEMERKAEELELAREKEREAGGTGDDEAKRLFAELKGDKTPASSETPAAVTPSGASGTATPVSDVSMPPPARGLGPKRGKAAELTLDTKKPVEPPEPSATLKALQSARKLEDLSKVTYPSEIASPSAALNQNAPSSRGFKYDKTFLLQFQSIFKEKPSLDWDAKIRDALGEGDSARPSASGRTPSGLGPRQPSGRPSAGPGGFSGPMGSFGGGPGGRPLPPGTTSEQRFAMSNQSSMRGNPIANPFGQMGRGGMAMGRQPSNNVPGSPRIGGSSRGGSRAESKRNKHGGKNMQDEKAMPLTAGMNVTALETSSTGWKPRSVGTQSALGPPVGGDGHMDPETVQRKVKAALNKMTPEKFDRIADQILVIAAQSKDESDGRSLRQVIQLTFEKATDEAHWASMYAMFCRKMLESMSADIKDENVKDKNGNVVTGGNLFRKYLLNRCQEEFERGWKVNLPPRKEGETEETTMMSDEYYEAMAAKRRGLGLVKFIGELFKLQMLTERIMHECVKKLVDYEGVPDEAEIESLTSLLKTIGKQLDDPQSKGQARMDIYFERIKATVDIPELPSRLRFMLMDIIDLRDKGWVSKDDNKGPKTITEIRVEAERAAQAAEAARLAQQANRGRGGGMPMGRGDARSFSGYGAMPPPDNSNRVATDDLRRLGARSSRNTSNTTGGMGPMLGPRTNSGRRGLGPGSFLARGGEDSGASSRTGTPPANKDKEKKDESSNNAFSALAALENETPNSPPSNPASPPAQKAQPSIDRTRSRSPEKKAE